MAGNRVEQRMPRLGVPGPGSDGVISPPRLVRGRAALVRVALAAASSRFAGAGDVAVQPTSEVPGSRGTQANHGDQRNATNNGEIHPMIRAELSRVECSDADHADRSQPLARKIGPVAVFAAALSIDLVTKAWAAAVLTEPVRIADWLNLMLQHNAGMFFRNRSRFDGVLGLRVHRPGLVRMACLSLEECVCRALSRRRAVRGGRRGGRSMSGVNARRGRRECTSP